MNGWLTEQANTPSGQFLIMILFFGIPITIASFIWAMGIKKRK